METPSLQMLSGSRGGDRIPIWLAWWLLPVLSTGTQEAEGELQ